MYVADLRARRGAWLDAVPAGSGSADGAGGSRTTRQTTPSCRRAHRVAAGWLARLQAAARERRARSPPSARSALGAGPTSLRISARPVGARAAARAAPRRSRPRVRRRRARLHARHAGSARARRTGRRGVRGALQRGRAAARRGRRRPRRRRRRGRRTPAAPLPEEHEWQREQEELEPLGRGVALARRAVGGLSVTLDGARAERRRWRARRCTRSSSPRRCTARGRCGCASWFRRTCCPKRRRCSPRSRASSCSAALGIDQSTPRSDDRPPARTRSSSAADAKLLRRVAAPAGDHPPGSARYHNPAYHAPSRGWEAHRRLTRGDARARPTSSSRSPGTSRATCCARTSPTPGRLRGRPDRHPTTGCPGSRRARAPPAGSRSARGAAVPRLRRHRPAPQEPAVRPRAARRAARPRLGRPARARRIARADRRSEAERDARRAARPEHARRVVDLGRSTSRARLAVRERRGGRLPDDLGGIRPDPVRGAGPARRACTPAGSSLDELLPDTATLAPWDAATSADRALACCATRRAPPRWSQRVAAAGGRLRLGPHRRAARRLLRGGPARPPSAAASVAWTSLAAEDRLGHFESLHAQLVETIGPTGLSLVGTTRCCPRMRSARSPGWPGARSPAGRFCARSRACAGSWRATPRADAAAGANTTRAPRSTHDLDPEPALAELEQDGHRRDEERRRVAVVVATAGRVQRHRLDRRLEHDQAAARGGERDTLSIAVAKSSRW